MDFRQLETFIEVAKLKSFSKAADKLFITQPTVTNHIQNLETELGTILINRMGKKITLTKAGTVLYKNALNIINAFEMTKFELDSFKGHIHGQLDIISSSIPRKYLLPSIMHDFLCIYPDVVFSILDNDSREVISGILEGNYDFGFVGAKHESYKLEYIKIMEDKLVLITPLEFRKDLKNYDKIQLKDIINSNFILRETGSGTREVLEKKLSELDICINDLKIVAYIEDTESIKELVALGTGVSFLSEKAVQNDLGNKKYKTLYIADMDLNRDFYFVYHKKRQLSPLGETFKEFVLKK